MMGTQSGISKLRSNNEGMLSNSHRFRNGDFCFSLFFVIALLEPRLILFLFLFVNQLRIPRIYSKSISFKYENSDLVYYFIITVTFANSPEVFCKF